MTNRLESGVSHEQLVMELEIGQEAGGFQIEEVLGRGGMGVVYRAQDIALARDVALKVIKPELAEDDQFVRRFQTEARVLAKLNSPYIVGVHALKQTESGLFIVMEYVEGGDLSDVLTGQPLPLERTLDIVKQLLKAIRRAHEAGVIHRDIKPQNIMVASTGEVKVTDFGLAKLRHADMASTMTQGVVGTLYYMSPEQIRGEELDGRTDLWAIGVVLFEMLVGKRPFTAEYEAGVMYALLSMDVPIPDEVLVTLPAGLSGIVAKALSKDREERFSSASEMLSAIEEIENPGSVQAQPAEHAPVAPERSSSTKWLGVGMALGAIAIVALAGYLLLPRFLAAEAPPRTVSLDTIPPGADVLVNGASIGATPIANFRLDDGTDSLAVGLRMAGFVNMDTVLSSGGTHQLALDVEFVPEDPVQRQPATAVETSPTSTDPVRPSSRSDASVPSSRVAVGSVDLLVEPSAGATVRIDGGESHQPGIMELPAGKHTVRFTSPAYGQIEETIDIKQGTNQTVTCHFEATVQVHSGNVWATVYLNGERTELTTPQQLMLGPGTYTVSLRRFGYDVELMEGDSEPIVVARSCAQSPRRDLVFQLSESRP
ncbi:MAG: serine/threonine protein kinase [Rhodothermales bacterium]